MDYNLTLPYPVSVNRMYERSFKGVRLSDAARAFKEEVAICVRNEDIETLSGEIGVSIDVYRPAQRGDLDNTLKITLDSLNGLAWYDDKQIIDLRAKRWDDPKNPRIELYIWQIGIEDE
jgi:crossover junction endodeoxyribonuclease RusA